MRPLVLTATVSITFLIADAVVGDTVSQAALSEAVSVSVEEVALEKVIVCVGGFVAPCTA